VHHLLSKLIGSCFFVCAISCVSSVNAENSPPQHNRRSTTEATSNAKKVEINACERITFSEVPATVGRETPLHPLFIPKFLVVDLAGGLFKQIFWTGIEILRSEEGRGRYVADEVFKQASTDPLVSANLSGAEIRKIADEVGQIIGKRPGVPSSVRVMKEASLKFVDAIVQKQLRMLELPCKNSSDFKKLSDGILEQFNVCIGNADNKNEYAVCTADLESTAHSRVGTVALQALLRDSMGGLFPQTSAGLKELDVVIDHSRKAFDTCAQNRIFVSAPLQREAETKVCVGEGVVRAMSKVVHNIADQRLKTTDKDSTSREKKIKKALANLKNPPCALSGPILQNGAFTRDHYASLANLLKGKNGQDHFKAEIMKCGDSLAEFAGQAIIEETVTSHAAVKEYLTAGKTPAETAHILKTLTEEAVSNSYRPCIEKLKKLKLNPSTEAVKPIINPEECEDVVSAFVGSKIVDTILPQKLDDMIAELKDESARQRLKTHKDGAIAFFQKCKTENPWLGQSELIQCMSQSVDLFAGPLALEAASEELGADFIEGNPEIKKQVVDTVKGCLAKRFSEAKTLDALPAVVSEIGTRCNKEVQRNLVPVVAKEMIRTQYAAQKMDPAKLLNKPDADTPSKLDKHLATYQSELDKAKNADEQKSALAKLKANISWDAFEDIAKQKTHEFFPLTGEDLTATEIAANQKVHKKVEADFFNAQSKAKILDPQSHGRALLESVDKLTLTLAEEQLEQTIGSEIKDPAKQANMKKKLLGELENCIGENARHLRDKTWQKVDCTENLVQSASKEIFQVALEERIIGALGEETTKNPEFTSYLLQKMKDKHLTQANLEALAKVASKKDERNQWLHEMQNKITADVAKEVFHMKTENLLPIPEEFIVLGEDGKPKALNLEQKLDAKRFAHLSTEELILKHCLSKVPYAGISKEEKKRQSDSCLAKYIKNGAEITTRTLSETALKKYITSPENLELGKTIVSKSQEEYKTCLKDLESRLGAKVTVENPAFVDGVMKCSTLAGSQAAMNLGILLTSKDSDRTTHKIPPKGSNQVEQLLVYTSNACFYTYQNECAKNVSELQDQMKAHAQNPASTAKDMGNSVVKSKLMDRILVGAFAQEIESLLNTHLRPHKIDGDKFNSMDVGIAGIASGDYLTPLLNSPDGVSLLSDIKKNLLANPEYNPADDKEVKKRFKALLRQDKGKDSLTDRALRTLAKPSFYNHWDEELKGASSLLVGLGWTFNVINKNSLDYDKVIATPSGQKARNYFYDNVLSKNLQELNAQEMASLKKHLPADLYAKMEKDTSLVPSEQAYIQQVLRTKDPKLAEKIRPLNKADIEKIKVELGKLMKAGAKEAAKVK